MMHVMIAGNIGRDAETRTVGQDTVTGFSVASSTKRKGEETTTWVVCNLWGKRGPALAQYLTKGAQVTVIGELSQRTYDKDGQSRTSLECRVSDIKPQGGKSKSNAEPVPLNYPGSVDSEGGDEIPF